MPVDLLDQKKTPGERQPVDLLAKKPVAAKQPEGTAADALGQGLFGLSDEAAGLFAGVAGAFDPRLEGTSFKERYTGARDIARDKAEDYADKNPVTSTALEFASGSMTGVGLAAGVLRRAGGNKLKEFAAVGAGEGALAGYGDGEGDAVDQLQSTVLGATVGGVLGTAIPGVTGQVGRYLNRDKVAIEAEKAIARGSAGEGSMLADQAPELARTVATMPGRGQRIAEDALEARQLGQGERIEAAVKLGFGNDKDFYSAMDTVAANMQTKAKPLYEAAYAKPVRVTDKLKGVLRRAGEANVLKKAEKKMRIDGEVTGSQIKYLDYVKRELDDQIGKAQRAGKKNQSRILTGLKNDLLSEVDEQIPEYAAARKIFAGDASNKDALEAGRKFLREDAEALSRSVKDMSESEAEHFRIGAVRALADRIKSKSDTADSYKAIFNTPGMREKVRAIFPTEAAFEDFAQAMKVERDQFITRTKVLGNSTTFDKQSAAKDFLKQGALDAITGNPLIPGVARGALNYVLKGPVGRSENIRGELAEYLFSEDPRMRAELMDRIAKKYPGAKYSSGLLGASAGGGAVIAQ